MESDKQPLFLTEQSLVPQLYLMLSTAVEMLKASKGTLQLYNPKTNTLAIMAHIGFNAEFLDHFKNVIPGNSAACGTALMTKQRVVIENVFLDFRFSHLAPIFQRYGYCAVQSTPMVDAHGQVFGVLSTHFDMPHRPSNQEFKLLDAYLKRTAPIIARRAQSKLAFTAALPSLQSFFQRKSRPSDFSKMSGQNN